MKSFIGLEVLNNYQNMKIFEDEKFSLDFLEILEKEEIDYKEAIFYAETDCDEECRFTAGWTGLFKDRLLVASAVCGNDEIRFYKGTFNRYERRVDFKREWKLRFALLSEVEKLKIERLVAGAVVIAVKTDGSEERLAIVSNRCIGGMLKLEKMVSEIKEKGEVSEKTLSEKDEELYCPKCGTMYPDADRKICPKCMNKGSLFFRTVSYLKYYKAKLAVKFFCYLIMAVLNLVWPYLNGTILYDKVLKKDDGFVDFLHLSAGDYVLALFLVVLTMVMTRVTIQAVGILQGVLTATITPKLVRQLKNEVFTSMGKLSIKFYNSKQTGSLMTRVLSDAEEVMGFFNDALPYFIINILTLISTIIIMLKLNPVLALFSMIFIPVTFMLSWFMRPQLWHRYGRRHRANRTLNSRVNDNLNGARVVKAFGKEQNETERFDKANKRLREAEMSVVAYDSKFYELYTGAEGLANLLVWVLGAYLVIYKQNVTLGLLITFAGYVQQLNGPMDFFSICIRWFTNCMNAAERIFEIIDAKPDIVEKEDAVKIERLRGDVELKNVTFGYEEHKPVLKNVSFKVKGGEMLGIVGRSGAGKTTIVSLINRLYDPDEGQVLIDGIDVKDLSFDTMRGNVAMVSQETYIFVGSVADNIRYTNKEASDEEVVRAAVLASAHDFICKLPDGYDTVVGATGRQLSGGEKQRISIARAILANPRILILDEATASVDTETELAIQESINMLIKNRTTISIAHRLSTLRDANRLVVIDEGKVVEEGTHEELTEKKGTYYKLRELQTKALALRD